MKGQNPEQETFYVVQSFTGSGQNSRMDAPVQASSESKAIETAERLAQRKSSVLVLSVTGCRKTGEFEDPEVLASYGSLIGEDENDTESLPF